MSNLILSLELELGKESFDQESSEQLVTNFVISWKGEQSAVSK